MELQIMCLTKSFVIATQIIRDELMIRVTSVEMCRSIPQSEWH